MDSNEAERVVEIRNRLGMHARAAVKFVQTANKFRAEVKVIKDGTEANGKSIMGLLTLVAAHRTTMKIVCVGDDADVAVAALSELVGCGFGEGVEP
jgi:phosphocarrier protein